MSQVGDPDVNLVCLAATAFLHWRDLDDFPEMMSAAIDGDELAKAIDRLCPN